MGVLEFREKDMKNKLPNQKLWQLLECVVPNLIGLYLDSYLGFALSVILLVWQWSAEKPDRTSTQRQKAIAFLLPAIALSLFLYIGSTSPTPAIAPPPTPQHCDRKQ